MDTFNAIAAKAIFAAAIAGTAIVVATGCAMLVSWLLGAPLPAEAEAKAWKFLDLGVQLLAYWGCFSVGYARGKEV